MRNMDDVFGLVKEGITVEIKRTDGRIHAALVSGVNKENKSVTVEWFEGNETKGKEIDLESILALNPNLAPSSITNPSIMASGNKLSRNCTRGSIPTMQANSKGSYRSRGMQGRPTNIMAAPTIVETTTTAITPITPVSSAPGKTAPVFQQPSIPPPIQHTASQQSIGGKGGRRSNVVKEVEKLKKNREERRQKQAELREEKEALMNIDPGNPNWEFLAMIKDYRSGLEYRPLIEADPVEDHRITVCVRKRPVNKREASKKEVDIVTVPTKNQIVVHEPKNKVDLTKYLENHLFRFDYAFNEDCSNELVYKFSAQPLVQTIFEGGMATCFAYGQTGSGKTHTMGGDFHGKTQDCKKGIYAMAARDVFKFLRSSKYKCLNLSVSASFFEIYSGRVFDLLADKAKLRVLEDGKQQVQVVGLVETSVESVDDVLKLIQRGNNARTSGQTAVNSNSSRSHAVFQIILRNVAVNKIHGKFSLIDLAGNERGADTHSHSRKTRLEGAEINKSLLALKECIRALGRRNAHLPFRACKLTQVLRDSFIGDKSRTCMIAMISPGMSSCEHSLNTLRYADRVKELTATDPAENKRQGSPIKTNSNHDNGEDYDMEEDDDLATLRSLNDRELPLELYNFHEAVSQLQELEDEVLDTHKTMYENEVSMQNKIGELLTVTRDVDYDQDAYSQELRELINQKVANAMQWQAFGEKVDNYRAKLAAEESLSQMINSESRFQRYN